MNTSELRDRARGQWPRILASCGIAVPPTPTKHGPCPACGGKDRFRFDDQDGTGTWFCNQCDPKAGDGFALIQNVKGCDPKQAMRLVADVLGTTRKATRRPPQAKTPRGEGGRNIPSNDTATLQHPAGCTLRAYADAKRLGVTLLQQWGITEVFYLGRPALKIPYLDPSGAEVAARFRIALEGNAKFRWRKGDKPSLYGIQHLAEARKAGAVVIVEGESDTHTLAQHEILAFGLPGAGNWKEERDAPYFEGILTIYVVIEPGAGGQAALTWLGRSCIRDRVRLVDLGEAKDPSGLYLKHPKGFRQAWDAALAKARPWAEVQQCTARDEAAQAWQACSTLAQCTNILDGVVEILTVRGVVGEARAVKLIYLMLTSRLLDRPTSGAIKGPSSAGKSFVVEQVLSLFPPSAFYALSAMSDRALAYSKEPLKHRVLVIYEAAGLQGDMATYLVRSLLSEGRVRYETVEQTKNGMRPKLIEREGPTGLLVTTTQVSLHPENETRLLSIPVKDTQEQTKAILRALATERDSAVDPTPWQALQTWLQHGEHRVTIPFAGQLAKLIPPVAVRLRRDFRTILTLICANAVLQQGSRKRDAGGRIVATIEDYAVVRELVADLIGEAVGATVVASVREAVEAVRTHSPTCNDEVSLNQVAKTLGIDKSAASRRVRAATLAGYLVNLEEKKGKPARLVLGEPLPGERSILPMPEELEATAGQWGTVAERGASTATPEEALSLDNGAPNGDRCTVAMESGGEHPPPSP